MKTSVKITALLVAAIVVVGAASGIRRSVKKEKPCYTAEEVRFLVNSGGYSQRQAEEALSLSCEFPVQAKRIVAP